MLEQKNKNRARVKVAVFFVLAVHGVGLMALLMQGCHKEEPSSNQTASADTNTAAPPMAASNPAPVVPDVATATPAVPTNPPAVDPTTTAPGTNPSEYTVVQGDNFWTIGKKFNVSTKAIADANPGVDPAKLKIGQKLHVPAAAPKVTPTVAATGTTSTSATGEQLYTVKSGDNLIKIAAQFSTSVKAIRSANDLKTDGIKVGQKLKIPSKATASTTDTTSSIVATSTPAR
ncbi:MAG TPA: LysM peptidoglycan-binding domain-containing protein [Candidatus Dormibacteraeota bacterium]|nr:LysM peptidoglycan-binding domain-containing protein [Candidatus Dormibacteraeota bacterium]